MSRRTDRTITSSFFESQAGELAHDQRSEPVSRLRKTNVDRPELHWPTRLEQQENAGQDAQKSQTSHPPNPGAPKRALPKQGRSTRRGEAYPLGYVEGLNDTRTLLANYFSMLLAAP